LPATWTIIAGTYFVMSLVTAAVYGWDKRCAVRGRRRVLEARLHLLEFMGGWPGAAVARSAFRHKRRKVRFMIVSWAIVIAHALGWSGAWWIATR
jgi:uncharacterized membrane protein YsdA (DUF1294 family)